MKGVRRESLCRLGSVPTNGVRESEKMEGSRVFP
jgi:hypothetical protein